MKIIRIGIGILCVVLLFFMLYPAFGFGVFNIGNLSGTILFSVALLCDIRLDVFVRIIRRLWGTSVGKVVVGAGIVVCIGGFAGIAAGTCAMVTAMNRIPEPDATVVVLGCRVIGTRPSRILQERLDAAYVYLTEHENASCILSGGQGADESISEAECMYRYLVGRGIDESRLYKEEESTTTRENLQNSKTLMETYHLNSQIAIVTSEFHEYRAKLTAQSLGIVSAAVPAKTAWWLLPPNYIRELYAIWYTWMINMAERL